jgi:glucose/arabinose dehydrogenase
MKKIYTFLFLLAAAPAICQTWQVGNTTLTESNLVTGLTLPWEMIWGPDDFIWCTTRPGKVLHIDPANGNYTVILDKSSVVPGSGGNEPGMLGMALHPNFLTNNKVYIVYNYMVGNTIKERLSMFIWDGAMLGSESILVDNIAGNWIHNGSRLLFAPDGKILMTTGDTGTGGALSQDSLSLNGKVLRINDDGSIPSDNPFGNSYVYSMGHRNGQGLCIGPNGIIYESEHGQNNSDELNIIEAGRNYGWPTVEGACNTTAEIAFCTTNNVKEPVTEWSPCRAVNGIEFYNHPAIPEWQGTMLMAVLGGLQSQYMRLAVLHFSADGLTVTSEDSYFSSFNKRIRDICVNPYTGSVYVAFNGTNYPGSGPNIIKEFKNLNYGVNVDEVAPRNKQQIALYPNPADEYIQIEFSPSFVGSNAKIYSFTGQMVAEIQISSIKDRLDCSKWEAGNYFIEATSSLGTMSKTFIVR